MELGEKIRQARLEAGLSQRQLCGETITRNMLSQIENGSARPSMDTLSFLAAALNKPVSWFLEEDAVVSPNQERMERARALWKAGDISALMEELEAFVLPDSVFVQEYGLLKYLALLEAAKIALEEKRLPYALELLQRAAETESGYITAPLLRQRKLLLAKAGTYQHFYEEDEALLIRAAQETDSQRALALLEAAEDHSTPRWKWLAGRAYFQLKRFQEAIASLSQEEESRETVEMLEVCYREIGDFRMAYEYACKHRKL